MHRFAISRRTFTGLLAITAVSAASLAGIGCGPPGIVVKQANPNPMVGKNEFVVEPVTYPGLMVGNKPEAVYVGEKKPEQQQSFEADKQETAKNLIEVLIADAGKKGIKIAPPSGAPGMFNIRPAITFYEPGTFNGFVNINTQLKGTMQIVDGQGQVLDEVIFTTQVEANLINPSSGGRMHTAGKRLGEQMAEYLRFRIAAPGK